MNIATCTRIIGFDSGHRVVNHESKCKNFHGHRYKAEITCQAQQLDSLGRVIDFSVIKEVFGKWIDDNLDHTMILSKLDKRYGEILQEAGNKPIYYVDFNPTAENLSKLLYDKGNKLLKKYNIKVIKIRLWETPNCYADYKQ